MRPASVPTNRRIVLAVIALGGLFGVILATHPAQAQIEPPPRPPGFGLRGDGIQGGGIRGGGIQGGGIRGGGIQGGGIQGGGMGGFGHEWVFTCGQCGREVGRGRFSTDSKRHSVCPHCGVRFHDQGFGGAGGGLRLTGPTSGTSGGVGSDWSGNSWSRWSMSGWEDGLLYVVAGLGGLALLLGGVVGVLSLMNRQALREMELEYES